MKAFYKYHDYDIESIEMSIKKWIKYVIHAWDNVTSATIENCWMKANILPNDNDNYEDYNIELELKHFKELEKVQVLIDKLDFDDPLTADKFVKCDKSEVAYEIISDKEIIKAIRPKKDNMETIDIPSPKITHDEVIESYNKVIVYLEQQEGDCNELKFIKRLKKDVLKCHFISVRQVNLDDLLQ